MKWSDNLIRDMKDAPSKKDMQDMLLDEAIQTVADAAKKDPTVLLKLDKELSNGKRN